MPWSVYDSPEHQALGYAARALLMDIARQYTGQNNGKLMATKKVLEKLGNKMSPDTLNRALKELLASGLLIRTRMGRRPNIAALYAIHWRTVDWRSSEPTVVATLLGKSIDVYGNRSRERPKKALCATGIVVVEAQKTA